MVVDIARVPNPMEELENLARVCTPDVRVLVIGEDSDVGLYRELVRNMGVAEYVHKPLTRDKVARLFVPQIAGVTMDTSAHPRRQRDRCVRRARGRRCDHGGGQSRTAAHRRHARPCRPSGPPSAAGHHRVDARREARGGLRIALEQPERADALFLDRVAVEINERLRLVAADESLDGTPSPTPDGMRRVLDLLRRRFNYIVMDLPMPATIAEMQALRAARHLLVVMAPDLASIRDADRLRQLAAGLGNSHTTIVLNRVGMPGG